MFLVQRMKGPAVLLLLCLLSFAFCSRFTEERFVFDHSGERCFPLSDLDANNCFITIILDTNRTNLPIEEAQSISTSFCQINYFYIISHKLVYSESFIEMESRIHYPYIIRSNYPDNGYFPFILSLLRSSNYTLVIKDDGFEQGLPDGSWIDESISFMSSSPSSTIVSCASPSTFARWRQVGGCLLMRSLELRQLITTTEFQKNPHDAFLYMEAAFRCVFGASVHFVVCPSFRPSEASASHSLRFRGDRLSLPAAAQQQASSCRRALGLEPVACEGRRARRREVSLVLSQYKRRYFGEQIEGILESSLPLGEVVVYQNGVFENYEELFARFPFITHIWSVNWNSPFFLRHLLPLLFPSFHHIVMDDDIIPSRFTFKRLLDVVDAFDAPSGVGARVIAKSSFPAASYDMICIDLLDNNRTVPVDFVIQVYARTYVQAKVYWRYRPYTHRNGDDIHGSLSWFMECHKRPYRTFFTEEGAYKNYGSDAVASYSTRTHQIVRPQTYRSWIMAGFKGLKAETVREGFPYTTEESERRYLEQNFKLCWRVCWKQGWPKRGEMGVEMRGWTQQ